MLKVEIDREELRRIIEEVLEIALAEPNSGHQSTTTPEGQLCYTLKEAAELLGLGSDHGHVVRDMWARGEIQTIKVGRRRCVERSELIAYLQRQRDSSRSR